MPGENKKRWCASCSKDHAGSVDVANRKCEDCKLRRPTFGDP